MSGEYLALLRGINVGGRNVIRMSDLKAWNAALVGMVLVFVALLP